MAPCWLPKSTKNASWSSLGGSWALLEASWSVLGSSWSVLERLGRVLGRLGAENEPSWARQATRALKIHSGSQLCLAAGRGQFLMKKENFGRETTERLRVSADQVTANSDTQLGAFGPGADPKRRRAANPPPHWPQKRGPKSNTQLAKSDGKSRQNRRQKWIKNQ